MQQQAKEKEIRERLKELNNKFVVARKVYDDLETQAAVFRSDIEFAELGLYPPTFSFDTSEKYKAAIESCRNEQKKLLKNGLAATKPENWTVNGSKKEGERMVKRNLDLALRAFNGEADSIIFKVNWSNFSQMKARLEKAYTAINNLNKSLEIVITERYYRAKLRELRLAFEYEQKKQEEKEEQRAIREELREAEKAEREIQRAKIAAEKEEAAYAKALAQATKALETAQGEKMSELQAEIEALNERLAAVKDRERALSMAQQTKAGHVYVISNIGAFGDRMFKIGMTRRLEPLDRVRELGDASVPFKFDVHALIFSENAPELERSLHSTFEHNRVNLINPRKEFFYSTVEELERVLKSELGADVDFIKDPEAREWRESQAILSNQADKDSANRSKRFPDSLLDLLADNEILV